MSFQYPALIWQSSITPGLGTLTLTGFADNLRTFSGALGSTAIVYYIIKGDSYYEYGVGTFDSGDQTLTRDTIIVSSNADALVDLPAATHSVYVTFPGEPWSFDSFSGDSTLTVLDNGNIQEFTGSAVSTLTLPDRATLPDGFKVPVFNDGTATLIVDGDSIEGLTECRLHPGQAAVLANGPSEWKLKRFCRVGVATLASASTVDLAMAAANYVTITGTVTINALGTVTRGEEFQLEFTGALTIAHNATTLILPGGANIAVAAGDCMRVVSGGAGTWRCIAFTRASGSSVAPPSLYCERLTSSFTIPPRATAATIFKFKIGGAGAGGGYGRSNTNGTGGGGASGDPIEVAFKGFTAGASVTVNIGTKGIGGTAAGSPATPGGDTTLVYAGETIATSAGGLAGQSDALGTLPVAGGALGSTTSASVGGTGLILVSSSIVNGHGSGQPGGWPNFANAGQFYTSGRGGSNPFGGGGQEALNGSDGKNGTGFSAGGSGGCRYIADQKGGDGTDGFGFVEYVL